VTFALNSALDYPILRERIPRCVVEPILLFCTSPDHPWGVLTTWEQERGCYAIFGGKPVTVAIGNEDEGDSREIRLFLAHERLGHYATVDEVAFWTRIHLASFAPVEE
jgi:hypothetical protein